VGGMYIDGDLNVRDPEMMSGQLIVKTNGIESFESRILSNDETILLNNKTQKIIEQIETKLE
jgi:malate/lactate dehydrogenase